MGLPSDFRGACFDAFGVLPQWEALEGRASASREWMGMWGTFGALFSVFGLRVIWGVNLDLT